MKKQYFTITAMMVILLLGSFTSTELKAQSFWTDYEHKKTITLEILKPSLDNGRETFLTSAMFLSLRFPVSKNFGIIGELPFAHFGYELYFNGNEYESTLGNPFFGFEYRIDKTPFFLEFGVRAPVAPDDDEDNGGAALLGLFTDFIDRTEAFAVDAVPVNLFANILYEHSSGFSFRIRTGPVLWIPVQKREESEVFLVYGLQLMYRIKMIRIGCGVTGRMIASEETGDFDQNSFHQLGLSLETSFGLVRPGLYFRIPFDEDLRDIVNWVFGISVGFRLEKNN